jgi:hypothetical protein
LETVGRRKRRNAIDSWQRVEAKLDMTGEGIKKASPCGYGKQEFNRKN